MDPVMYRIYAPHDIPTWRVYPPKELHGYDGEGNAYVDLDASIIKKLYAEVEQFERRAYEAATKAVKND